MADLDTIRADGQTSLSKVADALDAELDQLAAEFEELAPTAWDMRGSSAGLAALERLEAVNARAIAAQALRDWCAADDRAFNVNARSWRRPVSGEARGFFWAASMLAKGKRTFGVPEGVVPPRGSAAELSAGQDQGLKTVYAGRR